MLGGAAHVHNVPPTAATEAWPVSLLAGAAAGLASDVLSFPFETISLRAKVSSSGTLSGAARVILQQEGARGFFSGLSATLIASPVSNAVYWSAYEGLKRLLGGSNGSSEWRPEVYFAAGGIAELASLVVVPLEVARARLQLGSNPARATEGRIASSTNFTGVRAALAGIYAERGFAGLTAGWGATLSTDVVFSACQLCLYESVSGAPRERRGLFRLIRVPLSVLRPTRSTL